MSEPCFGSLQVVRLRAAKLAASGAPLTGADNGWVTRGVIDVDVSLTFEEGTKLSQKNGGGEICNNFRDCDKLTGADITLNLCQLEYGLIAFMTSADVISALDGGAPMGFEFPASTDSCPNGVSLELWTRAWDGSQQAVPDLSGGVEVAYHHWVFTRTKFNVGDVKFEDDFMQIPLTGFAEENANLTQNGPFDDWPADLGARGPFTSIGGVFLDTTIPDDACDFVSVTSAAS